MIKSFDFSFLGHSTNRSAPVKSLLGLPFRAMAARWQQRARGWNPSTHLMDWGMTLR
jgi:hypothetical protein